jgi:predicted lipoprotein with Yx(FWY)xxD motif
MTPSRSITLLAGAAIAALTALALSACGGGGAHASKPPPQSADGRVATVGLANNDLGRILVDSRGRTLYLFQKDSGGKSACFGACASAWPPLRVSGKPIVGGGLNAAKLGATNRSDGKRQVTYSGHPLYLYSGDASAGDTNGQGLTAFGASWFALSPAGNQVDEAASSRGADSGGGSGY